MKCIILCAGYATRLYPLTENFPKPLLEVKGKPIIDHLIDDLEEENKINQYIIVSNHKFVDHFNKWKETRKENVIVLDDGSVSNETRLGAVKDIHFALETLNINEDIIVLAGDNLLNFSLNKFINFYEEKKNNCIMTYAEEELRILQKCGVVEIDKNNKVLSFEEKPEKPKSKYAVPPFYIYRKEDLYLFEEALNSGCGVDAPGHFVEWFCKHATVYAYLMPDIRIDIGTLEDYLKIKN